MALNVEYSRGTPVGPQAVRGVLPNVEPGKRRGKFVVLAHPNKWELVGEEWLPVIQCLAPKAGAGGTVSIGDRLDDTGFRASLARDSYVDLTFDQRLTSKFGHLVQRHEMADGGAHYTPPWEMIGIAGGKTRDKTDEDLLHDFQRAVIEVLGPMPEEVLGDKIGVVELRLNALRLDRNGGPNVVRRIEAGDAQIAKWRACWSKQFGPKPKKGAA